MPPQPLHVPLDSMGLQKIERRPLVQLRCGQDVTFLVDCETDKEV